MQPFVHYHCPCTVARAAPNVDSPGAVLNTPAGKHAPVAAALPLDVDVSRPPPVISFSSQPIARLYFCEDCHRLKCTRCVQDDIICYYCPNCLFEVPTASVKNERNRCMRNCFQCPSCCSTLTVTATDAGATGAAVKYYLTCSACRWDSRDVELTFDRPNGLGQLMQKMDDARPEMKELYHLKEHFKNTMRLDTPATLGALGMVRRRFDTFISPLPDTTADDAEEADYQPLPLSQEQEDEESHQVEEAMTLTDADQVPTLQQRHRHPGEQPFNISTLYPERVHLRIKRSKRCRSCRHVLIKPDQKAVSTRYKIKLMAIHYVPTITIAQLPQLRVNEKVRVVLRFANPLYFPIQVTLAAPESEEVKVLAESFEVADFSDVWEYEDDISGPTSAALLAARAQRDRREKILSPGVYEQKGSSTCVLVELSPQQTTEDFKFRLMVKYTYVETPEEEERASNKDGEESDFDEDDPLGDRKAAKKKEEEGASDAVDDAGDDSVVIGDLREYRFWATIGCGPVVA